MTNSTSDGGPAIPIQPRLSFSPAARLTRLESVRFERVGDESLLVDIPTDRWLSLNPAACFIWENLNGKTLQEIAIEAEAEFETNQGLLLKDTMKFAQGLIDKGLALVEDPGE